MDKIDYIKALLDNDKELLQQMYRTFLPRIELLIVKNGGTKNDSWEVFQEAIVVILKMAKAEDFTLTSSFYTLLYGVCRNLWGNELSKKRRKEVTLSDTFTFKSEVNLERSLDEVEQMELYKEKFTQLREKCRQLLTLFFDGHKFKEIAKRVGYASDLAARKEKHKCQKHLIEMIQTDPRYKELL